MKNLIAVLGLVFAATTAFADVLPPESSTDPVADLNATPILGCAVAVASGSPTITLDVAMVQDANADFVIVSVNDAQGRYDFFTQEKKDSVLAGINAGQFFALLRNEQSEVADGTLTHAGMMIVSREQDGGLSAMIFARDNFYPFTCKMLVEAPVKTAPAATPSAVDLPATPGN